MKISGFSFVRNAGELYYPICESIRSVLPIVDEFIVAVDHNNPADRFMIGKIGDPKIRILDTTWDVDKYPSGTIYAQQTDLAKSHCTGDWLIYLQADEVIHEEDLPEITGACQKYLHDLQVEGMVFNYLHFWGDYHHHQIAHGWYRKEIRIIRNDAAIHSWRDAQSFCHITDFDGLNYLKPENSRKLRVIPLKARIFHYGWVRPLVIMREKIGQSNTLYHGRLARSGKMAGREFSFEYGPLGYLGRFTNSHPNIMKEWISRFNWGEELKRVSHKSRRRVFRHEKWKYRLLGFIKRKIPFLSNTGEFNNFILLKNH